MTKTSAFSSVALDLKTRPPTRGFVARIALTSYSGAGAGATLQFFIQGSTDNTTFVDVANYPTVLTAGTAAVSAEYFVPFCGPTPSYRYWRVDQRMAVATSSPSAVYSADLGIANR